MKRALIALLLSIFILAACDASTGENLSDSQIPENHAEVYEPFNLPRDQVAEITIFLGARSDEVAANLKESKELDEFYPILQGAQPPSGDAVTADWPYTVVIKLNDGREKELQFTGGGSVFTDMTDGRSHEIDRKKFNDFLSGYFEHS
ncbi:hypothetical protein [Paenibacillus tarimensis]|uniref:hypothetical protein n=1 Tax=Paenibacillus tarimensis TaxID=416012 RepID=UPI001F48D6E1|nr:hypothetical protein [Paenibacillus tarimensis]MCF2945463.1 hypothetical protein [Paenibacillus tarimensis]